jgi:AcrR family transcriptional regulator
MSAKTGGTNPNGERSAPRRSALLQTRSRKTRRELIRAALELWNEGDFEQAFEQTTAEDIARAAGVSKGTFYFHFAHKEDILLEMSWATGDVTIEEAEAGIDRGDDTRELVEQLMSSVARRVSRAPRPAVLRATSAWSRLLHTATEPDETMGFGKAFEIVIAHARECGDLPPEVEVNELALLLQAVTMDALVAWSASTMTAAQLAGMLRRRADVILSGAAVSYRR